MGKKLSLRYTTHLINCHHHHKGFNAVCNSAVNIAFLILQPKRTRIQKIQQGTKNVLRRIVPLAVSVGVKNAVTN